MENRRKDFLKSFAGLFAKSLHFLKACKYICVVLGRVLERLCFTFFYEKQMIFFFSRQFMFLLTRILF